MFGLQPLHIAAIVVLALLIFGPARLPEIGRAFGRTIGEFKDAATTVEEEMKKGLEDKPAVKRDSSSDSPSSTG